MRLLRRFPLAGLLVVLLAGGSFAFSCEQELSYCRTLVGDIVASTHFGKKASQADIVAWWQRKWIQGRPNGIIRVHYILEDLTPDEKDETYATYVLPGEHEISIILQVPIGQPAGEAFPPDCFDNLSRLKVSAADPGFSFDLNPYCSESYGPHEVGISLYWYSIKEKPVVEIGTNGPACVPAMLYGFNKEKGRYELVAEKCGG